MPSNYFVGTAATTAQVDTLTVGGTIETNDVFNVTMTDQAGSALTLAVVAGSTVIATVCTTIAAAFNASTDPRFTPVTAVAGSTTVTLTADVPGVPFICTVTTTENGGGAADAQTFVRAATTPNSSPNDYNAALNWSLLAVPVAGDDVVIDGRQAAHIYYGLNQSGVDLASFRRYQTAFAVGQVSIPLRIRSALIDLNVPPTDGTRLGVPALTNIDSGSAEAAVISVYGGYTQGTSGRASVGVKANHTSSVLNVYAGRVDVCNNNPADTGEFETVNVIGGNAYAILGAGLATLNQLNTDDGGGATVRCAVATLNADGTGLLTVEGAATVTTLTTGCPTIINTTGTINSLQAEQGSQVDTTQTANARTITAASVSGNATLRTNLHTTYTGGVLCLNGAHTSQVDAGDEVLIEFDVIP